MANSLIVQHLSTNGDGTGTTNAVGDYSSAATDFYISGPSVGGYHISRLLVLIEDQFATGGFNADEYANTGSALTNGITMQVETSGDVEEFDMTPTPIKQNTHWGMYCYDVDVKSWGSTPTNEVLLARWTFTKISPQGLVLTGQDKLVVTLNDDFTGLISQYFTVQGFDATSTY